MLLVIADNSQKLETMQSYDVMYFYLDHTLKIYFENLDLLINLRLRVCREIIESPKKLNIIQ